jgi:myo-inositol 2-dehydrogenase/D-chiro-inositol 1-dehydrogenase
VIGRGARLYNHRISSVAEDFDDAFLQLFLDDGGIAQVQVSRNHVAGYRNETLVYGERGHLHVGHFEGKPLEVRLQVYGPGRTWVDRTFPLRDYGPAVPVFITRFGPAYRAEVAHFAAQCRSGAPFSVGHREGLAALEVALAGSRALRTAEQAVPVAYAAN